MTLAGDLDPTLGHIVAIVRARLSPERVILFGSRARGDHRPDSDYDLLIVVDGNRTGSVVDELETTIRRELRERGFSVDPLVTTREAFERRRVDIGTIEFAADREGSVVFERAPDAAPQRVREPSPDPESLAEWVERAESDHEAMLRALHDPPITDAAVFHAHQCAEKYIKAALIVSGLQPSRTHGLSELLASAPTLRADGSVAQACSLLDDLWPKSRYPRERRPTVEEAQRAMRATDVVRAAVRMLS